MNAPAPQIKRGRKFDQVVDGARAVFMQDGFEGASVDDIARAAGVSKATLYSYFPDKRLLFIEVAKAECRAIADTALAEIDMSCKPAQVLRDAAQRMMGFFLSDFGYAVFRTVVAEAERFPEVGREFWDNGPSYARQVLIDYFAHAIERGELIIDDLDLAADQFAELCKADLHQRLLMGLDRAFSEDEMNRILQGAIEMFLARYSAGDWRAECADLI